MKHSLSLQGRGCNKTFVLHFIGEVNLPGDDQTIERQKARRHDFQPCRPAMMKLLSHGVCLFRGAFFYKNMITKTY